MSWYDDAEPRYGTICPDCKEQAPRHAHGCPNAELLDEDGCAACGNTGEVADPDHPDATSVEDRYLNGPPQMLVCPVCGGASCSR
jgi:hypothetical protein